MFLYYLAQACLLLAALCIASAAYNYIGVQRSLQNTIPVEGIVTEVKTTDAPPRNMKSQRYWGTEPKSLYFAVVSYRLDGLKFVEEADVLSSERDEYVVGSAIKIRVDPAHPRAFLIDEFSSLYGVSATYGFFGILFVFFWIPLFFVFGAYGSAAAHTLESLRHEGHKISALVTLVERDAAIPLDDLSEEVKAFLSKTGADSWIVYAEWQSPEDGKTHRFKSNGLVADPRLQRNDSVDVYIDPENPSRYVMSISKR